MDSTAEGKVVRMAANIHKATEEGETVYTYDEVVFTMDASRTETIKDIKDNFDAWWSYGAQGEEPEMTLEERVAMLEDYIISGGAEG